jgi:hypothetical protein
VANPKTTRKIPTLDPRKNKRPRQSVPGALCLKAKRRSVRTPVSPR